MLFKNASYLFLYFKYKIEHFVWAYLSFYLYFVKKQKEEG